MLAFSLRHSLSHATGSQNAGDRQGVSLVIDPIVQSTTLSAFIFITICDSATHFFNTERLETTSGLNLKLNIAGVSFDIGIGLETL
jgi:hypothetical protein